MKLEDKFEIVSENKNVSISLNYPSLDAMNLLDEFIKAVDEINQ